MRNVIQIAVVVVVVATEFYRVDSPDKNSGPFRLRRPDCHEKLLMHMGF